jgi:hypothetical protein
VHINIPDNIKTIKNSAFLNCLNLESVVLGKGLTTIEDNSFYNCNNLRTIYYGKGMDSWLTELSIGENNDILKTASPYYYTKNAPIGDGNYWHWDAENPNSPVIWDSRIPATENLKYDYNSDTNSYTITGSDANTVSQRLAIPTMILNTDTGKMG